MSFIMQLNSEQNVQPILSSLNGSKPPVVCSTGYNNVIFNEDCLITMSKIGKVADLVLTSPPYNTSRVGRTDSYASRYNGGGDKYNMRYENFNDSLSDDDYIDWTVNVFNGYDSVLKKDGCVLYNISYSSENTSLIWLVIAAVIKRTKFTTADCIIWKKNSAIPNNRSKNKMTRICEYIFIFCRKDELETFETNKQVSSIIEKTGQPNYENLFNFIEAENNDGSNDLNKATFSTELVRKCLRMYAKPGYVVYDSFMGTGTTAEACIIEKMTYIGSELSEEQCKYAEKRLGIRISQPTLF